MTALSFVWVHPYSQNSRCDTNTKSTPDMARTKQMLTKAEKEAMDA